MPTRCVAIVLFRHLLTAWIDPVWPSTGSPYCTFADVPPGVLDGGVAVDVGEQAEAEAVAVVGGIREAVDEHAGGGRLEGLAHAVVELVVNNGAPVLGLLVGHGLHICAGNTLTGRRSERQTQAHLMHIQDSSERDSCADKLPGAADASTSSAINLTHLHNYFSRAVPRSPLQ